MSKRTIRIFDTTLRDGEQSPGASMNLAEKMEVAQALVDLGVDIIEAGFPIASPGDFEAVREIAANLRGPVICGLARCNEADIDRAWEALKHNPRPRIHVFLATSAIHREFKLKMTREEITARAVAPRPRPPARSPATPARTTPARSSTSRSRPPPAGARAAAARRPRASPRSPASTSWSRPSTWSVAATTPAA